MNAVDPRVALLATLAATIAGGILSNPAIKHGSVEDARDVVRASVSFANHILRTVEGGDTFESMKAPTS